MKSMQRFISLFVAAVILLLCSPYVGTAQEESENPNDAWVLEYENMASRDVAIYTVPTQFKNDAPFKNDRRFPLVIQNNIHYVPVEMFLGLDNIRLHTDYSASYFYITNDDAKKYISFDTARNLATDHRYDPYHLETKIFHQTRYVPAKHVCEALGIAFEIYDNLAAGVYSIRFSDANAKIALDELIKMYSPIKKGDAQTDTQTPETQQPEQSQTSLEIGTRRIYLTINLSSYNGISNTLASLEKSGTPCVFFARPNDILSHADEIRQIIAYGQQIGFLLSSTSPIESYETAKRNLKLVAKKSSRLVRFEYGSSTVSLDDTQYSAFVDQNGLLVWDRNVSVNDSASMYKELYDKLYGFGYSTVCVSLNSGRNTAAAVERLSELVDDKWQLSFLTCNETTSPITYRTLR